MSEQTTQLNPWFSIWRQPRATARALVENPKLAGMKPWAIVLSYAVLGAVMTLIAFEYSIASGLGLDPLVISGMLATIPLTFLMWFLMSWLMKVSAGWLGGSVSTLQMRNATGWGMILGFWLLPLTALQQNLLLLIDFPLLMLMVPILALIIGIYAMVAFFKFLGEILGFSAWRAFGTSILVWLLMFVPLMLLMVGIGLLLGNS